MQGPWFTSHFLFFAQNKWLIDKLCLPSCFISFPNHTSSVYLIIIKNFNDEHRTIPPNFSFLFHKRNSSLQVLCKFVTRPIPLTLTSLHNTIHKLKCISSLRNWNFFYCFRLGYPAQLTFHPFTSRLNSSSVPYKPLFPQRLIHGATLPPVSAKLWLQPRVKLLIKTFNILLSRVHIFYGYKF